jgi:hypothetical protein
MRSPAEDDGRRVCASVKPGRKFLLMIRFLFILMLGPVHGKVNFVMYQYHQAGPFFCVCPFLLEGFMCPQTFKKKDLTI